MSQSANRSLDLLSRVIRSETPLGLMELATQASLDKSTASRLLESLVNQGFLQREPFTRRFEVGTKFLSLASIALRRVNLLNVIKPRLEELRDRTDETVTVHLKVGLDRICIDGIEGNHPIRRSVVLAEYIPLYLGVSSIVILSHMSQKAVSEVFSRLGNPSLQKTIERDMARTHERGFLHGIGQRIDGVGVLASPLFDVSGIKAALTIAGPADRWNRDKMEAFGPELKTVAERISREFGYSA